MSEENPYAPPAAEVVSTTPDTDLGRAETKRVAHLKHEAAIRAYGFLYALVGLLGFGGVVLSISFGLVNSSSRGLVQTLLLSLLCVPFLPAGYGLMRLKPWARSPSTILAALGLLAVPIGTVINAPLLCLLLTTKGVAVLHKDYARVIETTPHVNLAPVIAVVSFTLIFATLFGLGLLVALLRFG